MEVFLTPLVAGIIALIAFWWRRYASRQMVGEHSGVQITHQRRTRTVGRNTEIWTEYHVVLPSPLDSLNIVDGDAHVFRTQQFMPFEKLPTLGQPATDSDVFNGLFDYTARPTPEVERVLHRSNEVRELLVQLTELYDGMWVENGVLRVMNHAHGDDEILDIDRETLASFMILIDEAIARAHEPTVLDFENDEAVDEKVADHEYVSAD